MDKEELSMDNENTSSALSTHTNETQLISDASVLKQLKADVSMPRCELNRMISNPLPTASQITQKGSELPYKLTATP